MPKKLYPHSFEPPCSACCHYSRLWCRRLRKQILGGYFEEWSIHYTGKHRKPAAERRGQQADSSDLCVLECCHESCDRLQHRGSRGPTTRHPIYRASMDSSTRVQCMETLPPYSS